jgi:hypothetical protein
MSSCSHSSPAVEALPPFSRIQRTMTLLATSTPERRNRVRILFYGQSGLRQLWAYALADQLKARFPYADLDLRNLAIGGFSTQVLWRPAEQDLYPFYPDLLLLEVTGDHYKYEEIVAATRRRTTAEVLLLNYAASWLPTGDHTVDDKHLPNYYWAETMSYTHLPHFAKKYGCEMGDVRSFWKHYFIESGLRPHDLHPPGQHDFNAHGQALQQRLVNAFFHYDPALPTDSWRDLVRTYNVGQEAGWRDGKLTLECDGNRIDLLAANSAARGVGKLRASVRIDGKRPSEFPELYVITRPNDVPGIDWPWRVGSCIRVTWRTPLIVEDWTLRFTEMADDVSGFAFDVTGSVTGPDGHGRSGERFMSNSGRVILEPEDWWLKQAFNLCKTRMQVGRR